MKKTVFPALAFTAFAAATATATTLSPSGDAETDTSAIQAAIDTAQDGSVTLSPGSYKILRAITISNGVSLIGGGSAPDEAILSLATQTAEEGNQNVIKIVDSPNTIVSNLTVTARDVKSDRNTCGPNSGISMNSGLVSDCLITDIKTKNGGIHGGGVNLSGTGVVRGCTITHCEAYNTSGNVGAGEAIYMTGGLVENCVIVSNTVSYRCNPHDQAGGTVYISGGTLRGCLIANNVGHRNASGVVATGGTVESCTITGNRQYNADSDAHGVWIKGSGVMLCNNIIWDNTDSDGSLANIRLANSAAESSILFANDSTPVIPFGTGNISVDPQFVDAANGDYHCVYSYCVDVGGNQEWMADAVDLDGNPRIINSVVDMGCYELETPEGFACRMNLTSDGAADLSTVQIECSYVGCPGGTATGASWWFTRSQDGLMMETSGFNTSIQLPAGTWDARLEVYGGGKTATCEIRNAVNVIVSRVYANEKGRGEFPYDTVEKGLPSITEALGKLGADGTLYVAEGNYVISSRIRLVEGVCPRIVSIAGPDRTVVRLADTAVFDGDGNYGLYLECNEARVEGLTFVAGRQGPHYEGQEYYSYGFVKMTAAGAVVTNCVFRDLKKSTAQSTIHSGIGLDISSGTVSDCLFARINAYTSGGNSQYGGIIKITGGLVDRVRVEECWMAADSGYDPRGSGDVVGVYNGGILRNSLVTRCSSNHGAPIFVGGYNQATGGYAVNCTFVANTNEQNKAVHSTVGAFNHTGGLQVNGGSVTNCIVMDNWSVFCGAVSNIYNSAGAAGIGYTLVNDRQGDASFVTAENHNVAVAPNAKVFRKPADGDYVPATGSPALNAGLLLDWMSDAVDLAGRPRVISRIPDVGCYEGRAPSFEIRLR